MTRFNLEGIHFVDIEPQQLPDTHWQLLWQVNHEAFSRALEHRRQTEIDTYVGTVEHFRATSFDLNALLENGIYHRTQSYARPRLGIAYDGNWPVGFIRTADNVSGTTEEERQQKADGRWRNYRTLNLAAVYPSYQGRGIGLALEFVGLQTALRGQRGTAWTFPEEMPHSDALLQKLGPWVRPMGGQEPKSYMGEDAAQLVQQGYKITTARWAARALLLNPTTRPVAAPVLRQLQA